MEVGLTSGSGRFTLWKQPLYPLNKGLCGHQSLSGRCGGEKTSTTIRTPNHLAASRVTTVTILLQLLSCDCSYHIQGVPLATEPGISLIILTPMKILQRNLNRSTFVV